MKASSNERPLRVVVLPVENQSGTAAHVEDMRKSLISRLTKQGVEVPDDATVEQFLAKHRVRYTGGLDLETAKAFEEELGVDAVLITAVDLYNEVPPPRISLLSRLVSTGVKPTILWFDSVGMAGDDSPGLLGLGRIDDPVKLREKAIGRLFESLAGYLAGSKSAQGARKVFQPKSAFRSPVVGRDLRESFINFVLNRSSGDEGASPARIEVSLSDASGKTVTVEYAATGGGSAVEGRDYALKGNALTFHPGETVKTVEIDIKHNGIYDDNKTIELSLKNPKGALLGKVATHTYTIINSDPEPTVSFATASQQVKKNAGAATILVELSAVSGKDVSVPFMVGGTARTPANYSITPSPVVIKAGTQSAAITVAVADNGINEDDKTVVVSMGVPQDAAQGKTTMSTVTIVDTSPMPTVSFAQKDTRGDEGTSPAVLEVALSAASGRTVEVEYAATGGTAVKGKDYAVEGSALTFAPGETKKTIELDIKNRAVHDDDKTVEVSLTKAVNGVLGNATIHTYTIVNTTPPPAVAFVTERQRIRATARIAAIAVELSAVSGKDVTVPFLVSGKAKTAKNYIITPSPVVIKAGRRDAVITVSMENDDDTDTDETIDVTLSSPMNASLGRIKTHTLTIINRNAKPTIAVVPFANVSGKKDAGDVVMLQFVKELMKLGDFTVVEPGIVRQQLLTMRIIMYDGASLADIDLLIKSLDADLILTGKVFDYQDYIVSGGTPKVDFSVALIEKSRGRVIWASKSYNKGDDGVTMFGWGSINTANALVAEMARAARKAMVAW